MSPPSILASMVVLRTSIFVSLRTFYVGIQVQNAEKLSFLISVEKREVYVLKSYSVEILLFGVLVGGGIKRMKRRNTFFRGGCVILYLR